MRSAGDLAELLDIANRAADAAATVLLEHQRRLRAGADLGVDTKTSATDPVSLADQRSEVALVAVIHQARPDDALLGEEGSARTGTTGLRWVVDPLDGTVNYLYGHVGWSVSVALEESAPDEAGHSGWQPLVGVVLEPTTGDRYQATRGGGASCNGRALSVNDPVEPAMALIGTGFSYDRDHRRHQARIAANLLGEVRDLRRVGSAALDLCRVADGAVDGYYEDSTQRWDWAAGALIAREAGAVVTELRTMAGHCGVIAAGPALHPILARLLAR